MMRRQAAIISIIILAAAMLPAAGCGGSSAAGTIKLLDLTEPAGFAIYYPVSADVQPSLPAQAIDPRLAGVAGIDIASLSPAARALLAQNGFVLTPGQPGEIFEAYQQAAAPVFITLDSLSHSVQAVCSRALDGLEKDRLHGDLQGLTAAMLDVSSSFERAAGERGRAAARANQEFFGVAARLLDPEAVLPPGVEEKVAKELLLIEAGAGVDESPIFGYREDYGRYVPEGRYALSEGATRYFQAVTWYGRMGMRLRPAEGAQMREAGREETRQAILAVGGLHVARVGEESALAVWERLFQVIRFFVEGAEGLDAYDYTALMAEVYGREIPLSRLESDAELDVFIERALGLPRPRVPSGSQDGGAGEEVAAFSFLSRRAFPDAYILRQLVDPGVAGRYMPRGLDVPAALGSVRAREINLALYEDARFPAYEARVEALKREFATLGTQVTAGSIYWNRLYALRRMLFPPGSGFPAFMSNQAWAERSLYSFLGSWTEMRHDTVVCEKQGGAGGELGPAPAAPALPGYVEPDPEALARLAATVDLMRRGLAERNMLVPEVGERLGMLYSLLVSLKGMAEKELSNQPFSEEEAGVFRGFAGRLEYIDQVPGAAGSAAGSHAPLITDVYSDLEALEALIEAVGNPVIYHVIVPYQGRLYYTVGAGFSYYEFRQPLDDRLTDEAWRAMLESGRAPGPPPWTDTFLAQ